MKKVTVLAQTTVEVQRPGVNGQTRWFQMTVYPGDAIVADDVATALAAVSGALSGGAVAYVGPMDELSILLADIPVANIPQLGATTNLPATGAVLATAGGNTYSDAAVKTSIDGAVTALRAAAESRLDAAESKVDAILSALVTGGFMTAP